MPITPNANNIKCQSYQNTTSVLLCHASANEIDIYKFMHNMTQLKFMLNAAYAFGVAYLPCFN